MVTKFLHVTCIPGANLKGLLFHLGTSRDSKKNEEPAKQNVSQTSPSMSLPRFWQKNMDFSVTPRKINIEPENDGLEDDFPISRDLFSGSMFNLPGCTLVLNQNKKFREK